MADNKVKMRPFDIAERLQTKEQVAYCLKAVLEDQDPDFPQVSSGRHRSLQGHGKACQGNRPGARVALQVPERRRQPVVQDAVQPHQSPRHDDAHRLRHERQEDRARPRHPQAQRRVSLRAEGGRRLVSPKAETEQSPARLGRV